MAAAAELTIPEGANMRDIFDLCNENGLPSLAQGMIEFPPPEKLRKIASDVLLEDDKHTYRTRMGEDEYKTGIKFMMENTYGEKVSTDNILAVAGVAGGVSAALLSFRMRKPDAGVALMEPYYTFHETEVERAFQRYPVVIPSTGDKADPNFAELKNQVMAGKVHCVIATNPQNPSGRVFTQAEVDELKALSESHGLFVIFDECYLDMLFNGAVHASAVREGIMRNVVCCRGFSKCLGAQSWRCGYAVSHPDTCMEMMRMMDPLYICVNITQHAVGRFFTNHLDEFRSHMVDLNGIIKENWTNLSAAFVKAFGWTALEPNGTMYGMFKHTEETDLLACQRALRAGVGVCPGSIFFGDQRNPTKNTGWVRIHCGVSKAKAADIMARLEKATA